MKHVFIFFILCLFSGHSVAANIFPPSTPQFYNSESIYFDTEIHTLYIDLNELEEKVILFSIQQQNNVLYIEDISKSTHASIVEYNYGHLPQGQYTLELVTASFTKIIKTFTK